MFAFPMALALGNERFAWGRLAGLCLGLTGVLLIVMPEASLPERAMVIFIPLALIAIFLPPTWALWRVRGAERFPFFRTLGVHAVLCLLFYGLFRACGFVVFWDTM